MIGQLLEVDRVDGVGRANRIRLTSVTGVNLAKNLTENRGPLMEPKIELRVAELLASRLCHDLISPVGAVNSGIELMTEFGDGPDSESMALITSSARTASDKLLFFRIAYGNGGSGTNVALNAFGWLTCGVSVMRMVRLPWAMATVLILTSWPITMTPECSAITTRAT